MNCCILVLRGNLYLTLPQGFRVKLLLFLAPPLSLHNLSRFRQGKTNTQKTHSSVSGTAHTDTMSRHFILPGCYRSCLGTHGLPLRHAPARKPEGNPLISSALPVQLHTGPACHSSLFKMAKCVVILQHKKGFTSANVTI